MIETLAGLPTGTLLLALVLLVGWIVVLVWLSGMLLRGVANNTGWKDRGWRSLLLSFVILLAVIHFGNWAISWIDAAARGRSVPWPGFPPAFLIGSVAFGVGVAWVRARR